MQQAWQLFLVHIPDDLIQFCFTDFVCDLDRAELITQVQTPEHLIPGNGAMGGDYICYLVKSLILADTAARSPSSKSFAVDIHLIEADAANQKIAIDVVDRSPPGDEDFFAGDVANPSQVGKIEGIQNLDAKEVNAPNQSG